MTKGLPELPPDLLQRIEQFHASCQDMLNRYVLAFERDFNRHAVKHGAMPVDRAHNDLTRLLAIQINSGELPNGMVAGLLAEAIISGIAKKREGKG